LYFCFVAGIVRALCLDLEGEISLLFLWRIYISSISPEMASMEQPSSLLSPICVLVWVLILVQPFYMWLCGRFPRVMSSLMVNPSALPFAAQYGHAALNFQSVGMLVYHTNTTDRALHVATFCCDATAQVSLALCGWGPALVGPLRWILEASVDMTGWESLQYAVHDVSDTVLGWTLVLIGLSTVVLQAYSFGGRRLAVAVAAAWTLAATLHVVGFWLFLSDLPHAWGVDVAHHSACALLLGGTVLRVFGHMSEIQHVHIIGCHSFLAHYNPKLDAASWRAQPLRTLAHNGVFVMRAMIITSVACLTEFNAGMPFRLFPVLVHLVQMRATDLWREAYHPKASGADTPRTPTPAQTTETQTWQDRMLMAAASSSPPIMDVEELNAAASYIVAHGWCAYTSDMAVRLRLVYLLGLLLRRSGSSGSSTSKDHPLESYTQVCTCGSNTSPDTRADGTQDPHNTRPCLSKSTTQLLHLSPSALSIPTSAPQWKSRIFPGIDVLRQLSYSSNHVFMYQTRRRCILPIERPGWCCWGLWPELLLPPLQATDKNSALNTCTDNATDDLVQTLQVS
jgi:hypothetical protein